MPDRKTPFPTPWLWIALALLAWALPSPARLTGSDASPGQPTCRAAEPLVAPYPQAVGLDAAVPVEELPQVSAFVPEGEEQDQVGAPVEGTLPFAVPCSFRRVADRRPAAPRSTPSPYPLRC